MTFPTTLPRTERILLCLALVVIIIICMGVGNLFGKSGTERIRGRLRRSKSNRELEKGRAHGEYPLPLLKELKKSERIKREPKARFELATSSLPRRYSTGLSHLGTCYSCIQIYTCEEAVGLRLSLSRKYTTG